MSAIPKELRELVKLAQDGDAAGAAGRHRAAEPGQRRADAAARRQGDRPAGPESRGRVMAQPGRHPPLGRAEAPAARRAARRAISRSEEDPIPQPQPGEVVTRTIWLSIDPYMRGRLREEQTYAVASPDRRGHDRRDRRRGHRLGRTRLRRRRHRGRRARLADPFGHAGRAAGQDRRRARRRCRPISACSGCRARRPMPA